MSALAVGAVIALFKLAWLLLKHHAENNPRTMLGKLLNPTPRTRRASATVSRPVRVAAQAPRARKVVT